MNRFTVGSTKRDESFAVQCESEGAAGTLYTTSVLNVYGMLLYTTSVLNVYGMLLYTTSVLNIYGKLLLQPYTTNHVNVYGMLLIYLFTDRITNSFDSGSVLQLACCSAHSYLSSMVTSKQCTVLNVTNI